MSGRQARADEFVAYVDARRPYLRRVAYLVCGDWHAAEDLVQTALIKLYAAWPRIHTDGAEDAYVRRIIVRAHLDETRRPWRRERLGLDGVDAAAPEALSLEDSDALVTALKGLPERQRATVVLRYWCGLSVEETADDLGCTTGTVKSQTARAMAGLRTALSTDDVTTTERRSR
ncbi:SigE family RNA polymerase sigma factor [Jiangella rhizosphaerae]|uniref:SigE family RNA polymerase sigma factor n=1 Tax=Jiangella rhizosphaerae TaxID=2293569 RepID=A0A418KLI0_9ACTN|nr:SigE family RNA polymerase sigma factor [Jiangella rhizosphaerae]RIQ18409.1 SigE family RNA polymerase sigma factor [Jiangella rhizosphaerae]